MQRLTTTLRLKELGLLIGVVALAVLLIFSLIFTRGAVVQTAGLPDIVVIAGAIEHGQPLPQAHWNGSIVPYVWGGGHSATPGPSLGTCTGYTGAIQPCPANRTVGVDCSGFTRWVYSIAFGWDILGPGNTFVQIKVMHEVSAAAAMPGDLVFYSPDLHHVGIYIGHGEMIDAFETGTNVRTDPLLPDIYGFYHYPGNTRSVSS